MLVEDTRRAIETYVEDLLQRGPYKRHFSHDVVLSMVGTDQATEGPDDTEAFIDYLHTVAFEANPELIRGMRPAPTPSILRKLSRHGAGATPFFLCSATFG